VAVIAGGALSASYWGQQEKSGAVPAP